MIFQNVGNNLLVVVLESIIEFCIWDLVEGIVTWRKNLWWEISDPNSKFGGAEYIR